jgi:hypothetical protein
MREISVSWYPRKPSDHSFARDAIAGYMDHKATFVLFENGTALMLKPELDGQEVIAGAMSELKFKTDFSVMPMKDGNFLVCLVSPVCVFVSAEEAEEIISTLRSNQAIAMFPGESFVSNPKHPDHQLVGLTGRAKGHIDAVEQIQVARYVPSEA